MSDLKKTIMQDLQEEYVPRFQGLSKAGTAMAPAGGGGMPKPKAPKGVMGNQPPKAPAMPAAPKAPMAAGAPKPTPTLKTKIAKQDMATNSTMQAPVGDVGMQKEAKPESEQKYHIYEGKNRITDDNQTVTHKDIMGKHGSIQNFESKGFRMVAHNPKPKKPKIAGGAFGKSEIYEELMASYAPKFHSLRELFKSSPKLALSTLSAEKEKAILAKAEESGKVMTGAHISDYEKKPEGPKPKKIKGKKDEGSGGHVKKDELLMKQPLAPKPKTFASVYCKPKAKIQG
jgi:hypothetical protein